jgi:hypothetical protein
MSRDILDEFDQQRGQPVYPLVAARVGEIVEDRASGFCGDIVTIGRWSATSNRRRSAASVSSSTTWLPGPKKNGSRVRWPATMCW